MLPRWHILFGALFTFAIWLFFPSISPLYLAIVFFSSFLIDFDHYLVSALKNRKLSLFHSFDYYAAEGKRAAQERSSGLRQKSDFQVFHTVEFHLLVFLLGFVHPVFFFIFIGMLFHSICDLADLTTKDYLYRREFFFFSWLQRYFSQEGKTVRPKK